MELINEYAAKNVEKKNIDDIMQLIEHMSG